MANILSVNSDRTSLITQKRAPQPPNRPVPPAPLSRDHEQLLQLRGTMAQIRRLENQAMELAYRFNNCPKEEETNCIAQSMNVHTQLIERKRALTHLSQPQLIERKDILAQPTQSAIASTAPKLGDVILAIALSILGAYALYKCWGL